MERLPDELLVSIFKYTIQDVYQLLQLQLVCKNFHRLSNHASLWYYLFKLLYPTWSFQVPYSLHKQHLIDWKRHMLLLAEQQAYIGSHQFKLNALEPANKQELREPFVSDIDHTNTGVVALATQPNHIVFINYPLYTTLRELTLHIEIPPAWSCQIMGIQTVKIQDQKVRFCCVVIGQATAFDTEDNEEGIDEFNSDNEEEDDQMQIWKTVLIYRLSDDGQTTLVAHITMDDRSRFLGRDVFFFTQIDDMQPWLDTLSVDTERPHPFNVFMLVYGPTLPRYAGCAHVFQFDARSDLVDQDPTKVVWKWDSATRRLVKKDSTVTSTANINAYKPAQVISTVRLGTEVSCMILLRHPAQLNHLICTGNFDTNELTLYDWRFGLRVGVLPGTARSDSMEQPWGFEMTYAVPPSPSLICTTDLCMCGPRLVVVGDCEDTFNIKIWDLSHLLQVRWQPFVDDDHPLTPLSEEDELDMPFIYPWWNRGSNQLKWIATHQRQWDKGALPYSVKSDALLRTHELDAKVKYTAYNVLNSLVFLLNEDGLLKVMDIEMGHLLGETETGSNGVDVNVLAKREIIITKKQGILRGLLPM